MTPSPDSTTTLTVDETLLKRFHDEIKSKSPHAIHGSTGPRIVNPTPLVDLTETLLECGRSKYGMELPPGNSRIFGKFDSEIIGGSIKVRPAIEITEQAIVTGKLKR